MTSSKNNVRNDVHYTIQARSGNRLGSLECVKVIFRDRRLTRAGARRILVRETGDDSISVDRVEAVLMI